MNINFKNPEDKLRKEMFLEFMPVKYGYILETLDDLGFFTAPASTKYHGAYDGGLFDHSYRVAKTLVEYTKRIGLKWERPESPYIVGMLHDLCKCDNYVQDGQIYKYNPDIIIPGHGDKSVILIIQNLFDLTDEEIACIRHHMGAFETDTRMWEYYGRAIEKYPNVLYTHTADMHASRVLGV